MKKVFHFVVLLALFGAANISARPCARCDKEFHPREGENGRYCFDCVRVRQFDQACKLLFGSRGENDEIGQAMPKVVEVKFGEWGKLKKGEQPAWGEYITVFYPTLSHKEAKVIALEVNEARASVSPRALAEAAIALGKHAPKKDTPKYFLADTLFREAISLTILCGKVGNKPFLMQLKEMYKDAPFKNADVLEELEEEIKAGQKKK